MAKHVLWGNVLMLKKTIDKNQEKVNFCHIFFFFSRVDSCHFCAEVQGPVEYFKKKLCLGAVL